MKFLMGAVIGAVISLGSATVFRTFYARKYGQPFMVWPERRVLERQKKEEAHGVLSR